MTPSKFTISPEGPFSLKEAATFGFGQRAGAEWDDIMRLAFCVDGYRTQVGVELSQDADGTVHGVIHGAAEASPVRAQAGVELSQDPDGTVRGPTHNTAETGHGQDDTMRGPVHGNADVSAVRAQVARVLSLDHDGTDFARIAERDPVIARLQQAAPGLRPPLFYSPYEAAAWSVLSARRPARQMMTIRQRLSEAHGVTFDLAGQPLPAFPLPEALLEVDSFPGIPSDKLERLHGVASAALAGELDAAALFELGPDEAMTRLQRIKGIGPFYSSLIVIRGTGFADVLPLAEPKALALTARLYDLPEPIAETKFIELAESWRPLRTWAVVLIRAAGPRILADPPEPVKPAKAPRLLVAS